MGFAKNIASNPWLSRANLKALPSSTKVWSEYRFHRSSVLQVRRLMAYFEMCLSARRRIGSTVSRLRVYSIVFPNLWLVTSPQNARHLRLWEAMVWLILRVSEISPTFFGLFLSRFRMPTRLSFDSAVNSNEAAVTSVFRRMSCWLMIGHNSIGLFHS